MSRLVVMEEGLFLALVNHLEIVNGKKYNVQWGEAIGRDEVTGQEMFVPTIVSVGQWDSKGARIND